MGEALEMQTIPSVRSVRRLLFTKPNLLFPAPAHTHPRRTTSGEIHGRLTLPSRSLRPEGPHAGQHLPAACLEALVVPARGYAIFRVDLEKAWAGVGWRCRPDQRGRVYSHSFRFCLCEVSQTTVTKTRCRFVLRLLAGLDISETPNQSHCRADIHIYVNYMSMFMP